MQYILGRLRLRTDQDGLLSTPYKLLLTLIIGLILATTAVIAADYIFKENLRLRAQTIAASVDISQVESVLSTASPVESKVYHELKVKLGQLKLVDVDARNIYVLGLNQQGTYTIANSESPGSPDYASFGAPRPSSSLAISELFDNDDTFIETTSGNGASKLSAFAPIINYQTGKTVAVAGIDTPATTYFSLMVLASLVPIILTLAVCIIIVFLDRARQRRLETLRFRSELVSIASHELRTPLTGIRWSQEGLLHDKKIDPKVRTTLETMYDSTLRLQESIEDILQLASLQNQRASVLSKAPTNMTALISGIYATQKLPASQHGVKLEFDKSWPDDLMITCDALRMKRVLNNVISNAVKYTRPNTTVSTGYELVEGQHVISVTDQGIGIPKDELDKVFSGFYRATNAIAHDTNGTGMGLYLSRTVIDQHEGKMWLHSTLNKGTTVYIRLPK